LLEIDVTELLAMCSNLDVNFESEEHALIAYTSLAVDKEV